MNALDTSRQRHRERYLIHGPDGFGDAELLGLVVGTGSPPHSAMDLGVSLLAQFGDLSAVLRAPPHSLSEVSGVGPAKAVRIHAALEAGRRAASDRHRAARIILSPKSAVEVLQPEVAGKSVEELHALYLGRRGQLLHHACLSRGSSHNTIVDPHSIFRLGLLTGASRLILAHNHPSGDPRASPEDIAATRRVADAGRLLGLPLVDHLILAGGRWTSLAEEGLLPGPHWAG